MSAYDLISNTNITLHYIHYIILHYITLYSNGSDLYTPKNDTPTVETLRKFYLCDFRNK